MVVFAIILISVFIIDQIFKHFIRLNINYLEILDTFLPFLKITYVKNKGAAFGSMAGMRVYLIIFSIFVITIVIY